MNNQRIAHLLVCLMEECAEVSKECAKALRFGLRDTHSEDSGTPESRLKIELNDFVAVWERLLDAGLMVHHDDILVDKKYAKLWKAMKYSEERALVAPGLEVMAT